MDIPSRRQQPKAPASLSRRLTLAWVLLVVAALLGWVVWRLQEADEASRARRAAWDEAQRLRVDYRSSTVACGLRFPSGRVDRATWQEDTFRWRELKPELATSSDDSEGEQWAEFYDVPDAAARDRLLAGAHGDLTHPLIRRRLETNYFPSHTYEVDRLAERLRIYASGSQDGWSVRAAWYEAPFGLPWTYPPSGPRDAIGRRDMVDQLAQEAPWVWRTAREMPGSTWQDYQREERRYAGGFTDARERERMVQHFQRSHRHFYMVDAAREVLPGKVLILRRFGLLQGSHTLADAAGHLHAMIRSLRCGPAEALPAVAEPAAPASAP